jgi:hypothetical protein
MIAGAITAGAIVIFEVIPMTTPPMVNLIIRQQEHIIYPLKITAKPEDEHNIAILPLGMLFLLANQTNFKIEQNGTKSKKLQHRTFRIPEDVLKALQTEANSRGIPLSNLVNKILKDHLGVQLHPEKADFILTNKDFFRRIFNKIDEKSIEDFGREIGNAVVSEYTSSFFPEINSYTIVLFLESWFDRFQSYKHRIDEVNNRHSFSVNHDINTNFSKVLRVILEGLIEPITKSSLIFGELTSSCITFTFDI